MTLLRPMTPIRPVTGRHGLRGRLSPTMACALTLLAGIATGQNGPAYGAPLEPQATAQPRNDRSRANESVAKPPELRSETFRLMDAYVISNLQESLGLSDEQFARVLPLVKKLQSDRREFAMKRMAALRSLRRSLQSGTATEAGVSEILKDVKSAVADERAATVGNLDALDAALTPLQQAKYRVFEAEVDTRLRHLLARIQDRARPSSR